MLGLDGTAQGNWRYISPRWVDCKGNLGIKGSYKKSRINCNSK
jgi:hypothetical protein